MIPALKNFLKLLALGYALFIAGLLCGAWYREQVFFTLAGLFLALVPVMVGFLQIWDRILEVTRDCWMCGRDQHTGRYMSVTDWYARGRNDDGECTCCGRRLVQRGDRVFGATAVGTKAA